MQQGVRPNRMGLEMQGSSDVRFLEIRSNSTCGGKNHKCRVQQIDRVHIHTDRHNAYSQDG